MRRPSNQKRHSSKKRHLAGREDLAGASAERPARVGFLLLPGFPLMSYAAAVEPLRAANVLSGRPLYVWSHLTVDGAPVAASGGIRIEPDLAFEAAKRFDAAKGLDGAGRLDALFVCAGGNPAAFDHKPTFAKLSAISAGGVILGGMSGGAYVLARAGLLQGRRCTIHWEHMPALLEEFPDLRLERTLYVVDKDRITCAGGLAAFDMMAALIAAAHGDALATAIGEWYLRTRPRAGDDPQRISLRERYRVANPRLLKALSLMEEHIEAPLSRDDLACAAGVGVRQLERLFVVHLHQTISRHYHAIRLDRARSLLRQTSLSVVEAGLACGFVAAGHFSRVYSRRFGHSPRRERICDDLVKAD
jgi:transcriptional regulator GlxA family with amidase domain